jgi:hypothetical protein
MSNFTSIRDWFSKEKLIAILLVGLINGLLYVFIVPPWWHYDEPGHFEFAWQIANSSRLPPEGYDEKIRLEMAKSMVEYGYYRNNDQIPDLSGNTPIFIGTAASKYPLYYLLASLPLRLLRGADVVAQLYSARIVSVLLLLATSYLVWLALGELLPEGHSLQWMIALFVTLLPGLADTMTSINDDAGAVAAFSLFFWAAVRLLKRGSSLLNYELLAVSIVVCYWTKETAWPAIPLGFIVSLFSLFKKRHQWAPWVFVLAILISAPVLLFDWGGVANWYSLSPSKARVESSISPVGRHAFQVGNGLSFLQQQVDIARLRKLQKKTVTIGAWMWASRPAIASLPILSVVPLHKYEVSSPANEIVLTTIPVFYKTTFIIPDNVDRAWLSIRAIQQNVDFAEAMTPLSVYYDGIVMVEGDGFEGAPSFKDDSALLGEWDGRTFDNLVRNGGAESGAFFLKPFISEKLSAKLPISVDLFIASLQDRGGAEPYYRKIFSNMFQNFWARFARNKVALLGDPLSYDFLAVVTLAAVPGFFILAWRKRNLFLGGEAILVFASILIVWGLTLVRGEGGGTPDGTRPLAFPWVRYAFPAILPTSLLLCAGWWEGFRLLGKWFNFPSTYGFAGFISFLVSLNILSFISLHEYFHGDRGQIGLMLLLSLTASFFWVLKYGAVNDNN